MSTAQDHVRTIKVGHKQKGYNALQNQSIQKCKTKHMHNNNAHTNIKDEFVQELFPSTLPLVKTNHVRFGLDGNVDHSVGLIATRLSPENGP